MFLCIKICYHELFVREFIFRLHIGMMLLVHTNVALPNEISDPSLVQRGYEANLKSIKTQEEMRDSLFDITI